MLRLAGTRKPVPEFQLPDSADGCSTVNELMASLVTFPPNPLKTRPEKRHIWATYRLFTSGLFSVGLARGRLWTYLS